MPIVFSRRAESEKESLLHISLGFQIVVFSVLCFLPHFSIPSCFFSYEVTFTIKHSKFFCEVNFLNVPLYMWTIVLTLGKIVYTRNYRVGQK